MMGLNPTPYSVNPKLNPNSQLQELDMPAIGRAMMGPPGSSCAVEVLPNEYSEHILSIENTFSQHSCAVEVGPARERERARKRERETTHGLA